MISRYIGYTALYKILWPNLAGIFGVQTSDCYIIDWMRFLYIYLTYITFWNIYVYTYMDLSFEILLDEHATEVTWPVAAKVVE